MLKANNRQARHKAIMTRVLIKILDNSVLSQNLFFKGGTCASMLGYLDRFSVDLDFDLSAQKQSEEIATHLENIFAELNLEIKDKSKNVTQYYLKYEAPPQERNTLKVDAVDVPFKNNNYEKLLLPEINRFAICQTKETIFTNKLVAITDRYKQNKTIAGRDLYDIHHFLTNDFAINEALIKERCSLSATEYLEQLINFIQTHVTQTIINQDLNYLLDYKKFNAIRGTLKDETLMLLRARVPDSA